METIWAPWRLEYILSKKEPGCIFCKKPLEKNDRENLILHRGKSHFIIMNAYPYNNGHLMIVPYRHTSAISGWSDDEKLELMELLEISLELLKRTMSPNGFNIGVNMGESAGAGIGDHIHVHVVPRWSGDTNFMPVLGETRVIPEHLLDTYDKLRVALQDLLR